MSLRLALDIQSWNRNFSSLGQAVIVRRCRWSCLIPSLKSVILVIDREVSVVSNLKPQNNITTYHHHPKPLYHTTWSQTYTVSLNISIKEWSKVCAYWLSLWGAQTLAKQFNMLIRPAWNSSLVANPQLTYANERNACCQRSAKLNCSKISFRFDIKINLAAEYAVLLWDSDGVFNLPAV